MREGVERGVWGCREGGGGGKGTRGVNSKPTEQPLPSQFTISVMGTSLLFSFHYESNLSTILPNNSGITAYLLCVALVNWILFVVVLSAG